MATEEEAVTLRQFKVWADKQGGGGGSSIDVLTDTPTTMFDIPAGTASKYSAVLVRFRPSDTIRDVLVGCDMPSGTQQVLMDYDSHRFMVMGQSDGSVRVLQQMGASFEFTKIYGIKE